jgi:acyl-CoA thioesterase II
VVFFSHIDLHGVSSLSATNIKARYYRHITKYPQASTIFSGLECRKPDMSLYNKDKPPSDHRKLDYYRPTGPMPTTNLNLHACAHLYASDRNSLFIISNAVGYGDEVGTMGSLSHSVVFHGTSKDLVMRDDEWWLQEAWTPRSGHGRGMHESRIWDKRGKLVASTWQDGLVRKAEREEDQRQRLLWFEGMRKMGKYSGEVEKGLGRYKL